MLEPKLEEPVIEEPKLVKTKKKHKTKTKRQTKKEAQVISVEKLLEPEKTKEQLEVELKLLQERLEEKEKNIISLQAARAYTITAGTDETVPIGELKAIAFLFPDFPQAPTQRELGETIRPQYIAALRRLYMLADI